MRYRMSGMTLIELMIVVAIVGILAAIAYPSYRQQVLKSGRTEAHRTLMDVAQRLEKCYTQFGVYNTTTVGNCATLVGTLAGAGIRSEESRYIVMTTAITGTTYTLTATPQGGQRDDTKCMNFTLGQDNVRGVSGTDKDTPANCW